MIPVEEALRIVLREARVLGTERTPLESAAGRVLAADISADADQPPFAKSMMDGFALRSADLAPVPRQLEVVEEIAAGALPRRRIEKGQAARIMTGAPLPEGADAVQKVESTRPAGDGSQVLILEPVVRGANVAEKGRELKAGDRVLARGDLLTPARLGVLAAVGQANPLVHRRPRVAVIPTGDELVEPDFQPGPGQIRNSNGPFLAAACRRLGADVLQQGIVRDDPSELEVSLHQGFASDLLLLSGGVSMGTHDFVEQALDEAGVEIFFRKIAIRPGKPAVFGRKDHCLVFGLPGNPASSLVIFTVLAAAVVRKMQGFTNPDGLEMEAILDGDLTQHPGRTSYLPGRIDLRGDSRHVLPIPFTGSADLPAYAAADALLILPADRERMKVGERIRILPLL
jgi:molybdopterin molybdotransferase